MVCVKRVGKLLLPVGSISRSSRCLQVFACPQVLKESSIRRPAAFDTGHRSLLSKDRQEEECCSIIVQRLCFRATRPVGPVEGLRRFMEVPKAAVCILWPPLVL